MPRNFQRAFAVLVALKTIDLLLRGMPLPMVVAMAIGAGLLFVGAYPRLGAGMIALVLGALPWLSEFTLYSNHIWLMTIMAALIVLHAPTWLFCSNLSIVYGFSTVAKLQPEYLSGWPIASSFSPSPGGAIAMGLLPLWLFVWGSIVAEGFLTAGFWFRRTRPLAVLVGLALHGGMIVLMSPSLPVASQFILFAGLMFCMYPLFFAGDRVTVVWDDSCSFCGQWVAWFRRFDWNGTLTIVPLSQPDAYRRLGVDPERAAFALQAIRGGVVSEGYDAVTTVAASLPLPAAVVPVLRLPPVRWLGVRVYRRVALRRTCVVRPMGAASDGLDRVSS